MGAIRSALSIYYSDTENFPTDHLQSLAIDTKYMQAIPTLTIPSVAPNNNPGHENIIDGTNTLDDTATGAWFYNISDPVNATVAVNCTHLDTKGNVWSGY